jgi:hypothetical protein
VTVPRHVPVQGAGDGQGRRGLLLTNCTRIRVKTKTGLATNGIRRSCRQDADRLKVKSLLGGWMQRKD